MLESRVLQLLINRSAQIATLRLQGTLMVAEGFLTHSGSVRVCPRGNKFNGKRLKLAALRARSMASGQEVFM